MRIPNYLGSVNQQSFSSGEEFTDLVHDHNDPIVESESKTRRACKDGYNNKSSGVFNTQCISRVMAELIEALEIACCLGNDYLGRGKTSADHCSHFRRS